ncbi:hypothetical protein BH18VER1_BH18VER1_01400 [soil metagenome]
MHLRIPLTALLCLGATTALAQEQEGKLMDRIMRPNMSLQNTAEGKQFVSKKATTRKSVPTKTFQYSERRWGKSYAGMRKIQPGQFHTTTSRYQSTQATLRTRNEMLEKRSSYNSSAYAGVRAASDATRKFDGSEFNEADRKFLVQGKSQKSLSAKDEPLTIEQVRELLNKNK